MKTNSPAMFQSAAVICAAAVLLSAIPLFAADLGEVEPIFDCPPDDSRIMMRWWWFGPAVTKAGIEARNEADEGGRHRRLRSAADLSARRSTTKRRGSRTSSSCRRNSRRPEASRPRRHTNSACGWTSRWAAAGPTAGRSSQPARRRPAAHLERVTTRSRPAQRSACRRPAGAKGDCRLHRPAKTRRGRQPLQEVPIRDDAAQFPADLGGATQLTFFIAGQTGMKVKSPAFGAEGFVHRPLQPGRRRASSSTRSPSPKSRPAVPIRPTRFSATAWSRRRRLDPRTSSTSSRNAAAMISARCFRRCPTTSGPKTTEIRHDWERRSPRSSTTTSSRDCRNGPRPTARGSASRPTARRRPLSTAMPAPTCPKARAHVEALSRDPLGGLGQPPAGPPDHLSPRPGPGSIRPSSAPARWT